MIVGILKEIKIDENRVAITPAGAEVMAKRGHTVLVEADAGKVSGFENEAYATAGAEVVDAAEDIFKRSEMILRVKEPQINEYQFLREDLIYFSYLHLASSNGVAQPLIDEKSVAIAYETIQKAVELAAKQMAGAGWSMRIIHKDSQTAAAPAKQAAKILIESDQAVAIIGSASSGVIVPVAESVTCPAEILMISPGATAPYITTLAQDKGKDFLFRTAPSDKLQGVVLGKLAASLYSTASVMYVNNPYGQGLARQFQTSFERRGGLVTMVPHGEDVSESYVDELRNAFARLYGTKPLLGGHLDVLGVFSYPEHAKVYVKEAIEVFECKNFLFSDGSKSEELAKVIGPEKLEGMIGTSPGVTSGESYLKFKTAYDNEYGELPTTPFIANAYDAMAVIGLAAYASKAKGLPPTSANIRNQLPICGQSAWRLYWSRRI
jgi:ABC-type branched-subunit amino acid transport system substrate-binding protein